MQVIPTDFSHDGLAPGGPCPGALPPPAHASDASFGPPQFGFHVVPTRALSMALQMDPFPKVLTACAPPGYGKTVMLSRLFDELTARGNTGLWLTLDDRDHDLSTLLYRLGAAMQQAGIPGVAQALAASARFPDRGAAADALLHLLVEPARPTILFIDNLGFCHDPALGSVLHRLVFGLHPQLRLVLSSTREIPLDLARAKLEVGAVELRASHLSFDRGSTAELLQHAGIAHGGTQQLDRIVAHTEGWPAAIRLLQVLLRGEVDASGEPASAATGIDQVLGRFGGDHRDIAEVLTRRVLVEFLPGLVEFMVEIAQVREFNADLAAEMTGRPEARQWLHQLVERNVLIFPLDRSRRWFRFHTLLREFLLAEGEQTLAPARRRAVLDRAARWHLGQGDTTSAISIALEAGSTALAQELLDRIAHVVVGNHGHMSQLIHWVDKLLAAGIAPSPEVHTWFVWALCDSLQYERARQALDDLDQRAATDAAFQNISGGVQQRILFTRMLVNVWLDRLDSTREQAEVWLARDANADALKVAAVTAIAGIVDIDRGTLSAARARMQLAEAAINRADSAYGLAWVGILRACVDIGQARPNAASDLLAATRARAGRVVGHDASILLTLDFVHARALLDQGRGDAARKLAESSLHRAMHHGILTTLEQGLAACVAFWKGGEDEASGITADLLDRVAHCYPARSQLLLGASKIRRLLQLGRLREAQSLSERIGLTAQDHRADGALRMRGRGDWLLARLELEAAQHCSSQLALQVEASITAARADQRHRDAVELLLLSADLHQRNRQLHESVRQLSAAIVLAAPGNLIHPFNTMCQLITRLLSEKEARTIGLTGAAELAFFERLRAFTSAPAATPADRSAGRTEEPTLREIELLDLLDQGLNNEQVAGRLHLSVSTVKWHLHNLYAKLGVHSRSAALARARSLKLIGRS
jgi:LuxR family maltose regulon positive regulatory protein